MDIECIKSAARLLDRDCVNRCGLDLSKEALCIFVGEKTTKKPAFKVGDPKKFCRLATVEPNVGGVS